MKKIVATIPFLAFLLLIGLTASAQRQGQPLIDSLLYELPSMVEDSSKVKVLCDISFAYRVIDNEKGIEFGTEGLELSKKLDWKKGMARAYNALGNNYKASSNYASALEYFHKALSTYEELGLRKETAIILMNIGTIYRPLKEYKKALEFYDEALIIANEIDNKKLQAQLLGNKGVVYFETKQYAKQQEVNLRALSLFQEVGDADNEAWILSNLGDSYAESGDKEKGIEYHKKAIEIYDAFNNQAYKSSSLLNMGRIYYEMALEKPENSTEHRKLLNQSLDYLNQSKNILIELDDIDYLKDVYESLSMTYTELNDYKLAFENYKLYTTLKDSVSSGEVKSTIAQLETQREIEIHDREIEIQRLKKRTEFLYFSGGIALLILVIIFTVIGYLRQKSLNQLLNLEKQKSEELLLNILPSEVANELKMKGNTKAKYFDEVTVLFTDFKDFSKIAEKLSPQELVSEIDECYSAFDRIMEKHNIEKIKTIGDSYMAAGGLPLANKTHAIDVVSAALDIQIFMNELRERKAAEGKPAFKIRIGIHSGPVVAGIVGVKKFAYDIWGDTVNIASRMESSGEEGRVNISGSTYQLIKDHFNCEYRGKIAAKNKGEIDMYFLS